MDVTLPELVRYQERREVVVVRVGEVGVATMILKGREVGRVRDDVL